MTDADVGEAVATLREQIEALKRFRALLVFTRDDVDALRGAAVNWPYERPQFFNDLADRLDALLSFHADG